MEVQVREEGSETGKGKKEPSKWYASEQVTIFGNWGSILPESSKLLLKTSHRGTGTLES